MTSPSDVEAAEQVMKALKQGHVKTPHYVPDILSNLTYLKVIRGLCTQAVYARWNRLKKPSTLNQIYGFVDEWIHTAIATGQWRKKWTVPSKRTVDRRTNECADSRFYVDKVTPIVGIKAGIYIPNPYLFGDDVRVKLEALKGESS